MPIRTRTAVGVKDGDLCVPVEFIRVPVHAEANFHGEISGGEVLERVGKIYVEAVVGLFGCSDDLDRRRSYTIRML